MDFTSFANIYTLIYVRLLIIHSRYSYKLFKLSAFHVTTTIAYYYAVILQTINITMHVKTLFCAWLWITDSTVTLRVNKFCAYDSACDEIYMLKSYVLNFIRYLDVKLHI